MLRSVVKVTIQLFEYSSSHCVQEHISALSDGSLQGSMLAREAMASAAVALYAAAVLPSVPAQVTAEDLALGLFCPAHSCPSFLPGATHTSGQCRFIIASASDIERGHAAVLVYATGQTRQQPLYVTASALRN